MMRYGGSTPCVEIRTGSERLILDAGIGLYWLASEWRSNVSNAGDEAHILLTHTHWGHIQGLPFFPPMLTDGCALFVYGWGGDRSIEDRLLRQMDRTYCPVPDFFDDAIGARVRTRDVDEVPFSIGKTTVMARKVTHGAGSPTLGYRIERGPAAVAYIPDVEYLDAASRQPVLELARGVDLLIHDAHYTASEYESHRGQGHCSDADAVALARQAGARRLVLFHHHPDRDDDAVDDMVRRFSDLELPVEAAAERAEYHLA